MRTTTSRSSTRPSLTQPTWTALSNVFDTSTYEMAPFPTTHQHRPGCVQGPSDQYRGDGITAGVGGHDRSRAAAEAVHAGGANDPL